MITKFARLEFELFTQPSKSDFLRVHQLMIVSKKVEFIIITAYDKFKTRIRLKKQNILYNNDPFYISVEKGAEGFLGL